jgi:hypothetical protein
MLLLEDVGCTALTDDGFPQRGGAAPTWNVWPQAPHDNKACHHPKIH